MQAYAQGGAIMVETNPAGRHEATAASALPARYVGIYPTHHEVTLAVLGPHHDQPMALQRFPAAGRGGDLRRFHRYERAVRQALDAIFFGDPPASVAIRGQPSKGHTWAHVELLELGGLLRLRVLEWGWPLMEVSPWELMLFATGEVSPAPEALAAAVHAAWGHAFADLPSTLAYVLAHMARAVLRPVDYPPSRAEIAGRQLQVRQE